ncbi:uncharacterized protein J4E84_003223 [Alternaria hordeiaustralica]|uniref:uncharacterized protein n=1 Tax=Alternaria hordeiaustralica TaxID=1187925 RepID=UPI0020C1C50A|nr:uncharacterized protein J4E84_003223 [Alternaria hordeiaustralica]KAI4692254.1 hypothetical protein J4E84_003223 [Alternaria hordeiaustralica]
MASVPPSETPAVKKRGRPKKVVAEDAGPIPAVEASKVAVKKVAAKPAGKAKPVEVKKEKKTVTKSAKTVAPAATPAAKKDAPQLAVAPEQPTPVALSTSKIIEEVQAKGTLKKAQAAKVLDQAASSTDKKTAALQPQTREPTTKPASSPSKPAVSAASTTTPPTPPTSRPTSPRPTTIPLPSHPTKAPSPISSPPPPNPYPRFSKPTPSTRHIPPNPYPTSIRPSNQQAPPSPPHRQHPTRLIEPTPDIRLPPKYKPASRRVTAIMVSLPIVLVFGYELFERWRGKEVKQVFRETEGEGSTNE